VSDECAAKHRQLSDDDVACCASLTGVAGISLIAGRSRCTGVAGVTRVANGSRGAGFSLATLRTCRSRRSSNDGWDADIAGAQSERDDQQRG